MKSKKQENNISKSMIVPTLLLIIVGIFPLVRSIYELKSSQSLDVFLFLIGIIFELSGFYCLIITIRYKIKPFEYHEMFLVEEVVPVTENNRERLYNMCKVVDKGLRIKREKQVSKALIENEEFYAVLFKDCGKLNKSKVLSGDLIKKKNPYASFLYIAKSRKFVEGQIYSCDLMKYGTYFRIEVYKDTDFSIL